MSLMHKTAGSLSSMAARQATSREEMARLVLNMMVNTVIEALQRRIIILMVVVVVVYCVVTIALKPRAKKAKEARKNETGFKDGELLPNPERPSAQFLLMLYANIARLQPSEDMMKREKLRCHEAAKIRIEYIERTTRDPVQNACIYRDIVQARCEAAKQLNVHPDLVSIEPWLTIHTLVLTQSVLELCRDRNTMYYEPMLKILNEMPDAFCQHVTENEETYAAIVPPKLADTVKRLLDA